MTLPALRLTDDTDPAPRRAIPNAVDAGAAARDPERSADDMIGAWVRSLRLLMRLPRATSREIEQEIASHLEDRVRDLMVGGMSESAAARHAIAELGEIADTARRFREVHAGTQRRRLMNMITIAAASLALAGATITYTQQRAVPTRSVYQASAAGEAPRVSALRDPSSLSELPPDTTWEQFFNIVGEQTGLRVSVQWASLRALHNEPIISNCDPIGANLRGVTDLDDALDMINNDLNLFETNRIEYRMEPADAGAAGGPGASRAATASGGGGGGPGSNANAGRVVFASTDYFDRRETTLATYDLKEVIHARLGESASNRDLVDAEVRAVGSLVTKMVEPNNWEENGSDRASMWFFGTKMFVRAPQRMRSQIEWILSELPNAGAVSASSPPRQTPGDSLVATSLRQHAVTTVLGGPGGMTGDSAGGGTGAAK